MRPKFLVSTLTFFVSACMSAPDYLEQALQLADDNRAELERVIAHYDIVGDSQKQAAARFLIENMPGHYSYSTDRINDHYAIALDLARSELSPSEQYDSLLYLTKHQFAGLQRQSIRDVRVMKADYLIKNVDQAFDIWRNGKYAKHLTFD